jgi:ribonuclease BN (tRNA processing enzyme)
VSGSHRFLVLGAGSALVRAGLGCSGYALVRPNGRVLLVDCGPGTLRSLAACGHTLELVDAVLLSHEHADHVADLVHLLFARRNPRLATAPALEIVGPSGTRDLVDRALAFLGRDALPSGTTVRELDARAPGSDALGGVRFEFTPTGHTDTALAYAFDVGGARLVYSGDCGDERRLAALARDAELLVCECSSSDDAPLDGHLTPSAVARLAAAARPRHVLLTHFYPELEPAAAVHAVRAAWPGEVAAACDGLGLFVESGRLRGWRSAVTHGY